MMNLLFSILSCVVIHNVNGKCEGRINKYAAAIFYDRSFICGGSIVNPSYILTAGHCLSDRDVAKFDVLVGFDRITISSSPLYAAEKVHIHPLLSRPFPNGNLVKNDIGLIKLQVALTFSSTVQSIPLAIDSGPEYRLSCKQVVYRRDERNRNEWALELRSIKVVVTTLEDCRKFYLGQLFENQMCALDLNATSNPPAGDSGSPTVCNGKLFGVLSSGITISELIGPAKIFMVDPYLHWIANIIIPRE